MTSWSACRNSLLAATALGKPARLPHPGSQPQQHRRDWTAGRVRVQGARTSTLWKITLGFIIVGVIATDAKDVVRYIKISTM